jgi:hypothetical protein
MANERERSNQDLDVEDENVGGSSGDRQGESPREGTQERVGGRSEENIRGVGESDEDDFEDEEGDDLDEDAEVEGEGDGTI